MKNKNQKNLKNKKFRWGAYGRTKKYLRGVYPSFSALYNILLCVFAYSFRKMDFYFRLLPYFCNRKTKQKCFRVLWQTGTDGRTDNRRKVVIYIIYIILHVYNITL